MKNFTKFVLFLIAALFSASMAFAETGTETEKNATGGGAKDTQVDGRSYYIAGGYIAGTGSAQTGDMTSKGFKLRIGTDGNRVVFSVNDNYTITSLELTGASNYELNAEDGQEVKVTKVEVDGTEVTFAGGEAFKYRGQGESCTLTLSNIQAKESIAIYFDKGDSKGSQINASWAITWERPDATQPTITVTPAEVALVPGAAYQLSSKVDPDTFTTQWVSDNTEVATVDENGLVTAVAAGTANISLQWTDDATVATSAVVTVADFNADDYTVVKSFDFTAMGDVTLTIQTEAAGNIWNEGNNKPNAVFYCTNEGLEDIAVQAVVSNKKGWSIVDGMGLALASGAGRCAAIGNLKKGQFVEVVYTGSMFATGSHTDAVRKDDGAVKTAINMGVGRAIYKMEEDGLFGFELAKGNYVEKIVVYQVPAQPSEAYISFDQSRLDGWAFPKYVITNTEVSVPYYVQTYMGDLNSVVVTLMVNGAEADKQEVASVPFDEEFGEGVYNGEFTYTPTEQGDLNIQLLLSYDGSELNEGESETEVVTIAVSDTAPEAPVIENIAALKAYEAQGKEDVVLTLTDAKVTYVGTVEGYDPVTWDPTALDVVVFEDATGGIMWQGSGLGSLVSAGQVLNGKLALNIESAWGDISATLTNGLEGVTATEGTVLALTLDADNVLDYLAAPDWRLVELKNVTFKTVSGDYSDDLYVVSDEIGEVGVQDVLGIEVDLTDAAKADAVIGYVYTLYSGLITAFQPISVTNLTTGITEVKTVAADGAPVYNLNGMRVATAKKGLYIINGKKVMKK